ncbi:outer dense fiber protein 4 [Myotis yumanensis]|uniref:outer dense fiber protein 4 n=1 Tax=Myotis yumanensis TaxID=159337 RepID=UPI0038D43AB0
MVRAQAVRENEAGLGVCNLCWESTQLNCNQRLALALDPKKRKKRKLWIMGLLGSKAAVVVDLQMLGWKAPAGEMGRERRPSETIALSRNRVLYRHRDSLLPLKWKVAHTSRWKAQVLASVLSLIALSLMLIMAFSKAWLYPSTIRFFKRWPADVTEHIYTSTHVMSRGLLQICIFQTCFSSRDEEDNLELWTEHPFFGVAKITFSLSLMLGFFFTIWLYLPYIPGLQRVPFFGLVGCIISVCEVALLFSGLLLFPIDVWLYEVEKNFSIHIGWSYFIGWAVFILYLICAFLCYFNNKRFWSLILSSASSTLSFSSSSSSTLYTDGQIPLKN